ncbi:MAG: radical SAM protein, partial [Lachnospiraceae bacterium]|nr:radical SAM protein [Lachnospiraceae bacterium]
MDKIDIKSLTLEELEKYIKDMGEPAFRAGQIFDWMHKKYVKSFDDMTNISVNLRDRLKEECEYTILNTVTVLTSKQDDTKKFLFELQDGNVIESVFMRYKHGVSVCISSQVGCRMGCRFCASTIDGLCRNLKASEMLDQIYSIMRYTGERVANVVVMGSGEPMDNFDNLTRFIELISAPKGYDISTRNITVSTCGIVPKMKEFADRKYPVTLALSLHAVTDEKRKELMPIAN